MGKLSNKSVMILILFYKLQKYIPILIEYDKETQFIRVTMRKDGKYKYIESIATVEQYKSISNFVWGMDND